MIKFDDLWEAHATISDVDTPCMVDGKPAFSNQCAIRVGNALALCGFDTTTLPGAEHCWHHPKSEGHILRAEQLANALQKHRPSSFAEGVSIPVADFKDHIEDQQGIIFFKDYWLRNSDAPDQPTGDHIDLWNGSRLTDWTSWIRINMGLSIEGVWSDFEASQKIIFWKALK
ncbi:type VI secretion system amidase effector protein Tae4 [Litoribrevibacter albus]|uniref:Type VI secretion system (T6SS), amidase effector protein 4 n=1 Tax=Litoribrevibacter albus TaxID=1473156 RepID=A0AA37W7G6_9GAMM|nr:type VI secretion system amidase effector protein Tae4 [Litoribrevibacter albus]GLQ31334.1 hypothetical protein GCM10007876_18130 [Litoribrevibacter albus]